MKNKVLILLIILLILNLIIMLAIKFRSSVTMSVKDANIELNMISDEMLTQGDLAVFKIVAEEGTDLDSFKVKVINSANREVADGYIQKNEGIYEIVIDTSPLLSAKYKIKLYDENNVIISKDSFNVIILEDIREY